VAFETTGIVHGDVLDAGAQVFQDALGLVHVIGHLEDVACVEIIENRGALLDQYAEPLFGDVPGLELVLGFETGDGELNTIVSIGG
jgi:hypothetical protein